MSNEDLITKAAKLATSSDTNDRIKAAVIRGLKEAARRETPEAQSPEAVAERILAWRYGGEV